MRPVILLNGRQELNFETGLPFRQAASVTARSLREAARETQRVSKMFVFDCEALRRSINLDVQMSERDGEMNRNE